MLQKEKFIEGFKRWLSIMNYIDASVQYDPDRVSEFLAFVQGKGIQSIHAITSSTVNDFFEQLSKRKNQRTGATLGISTMRVYLTTINRFAKYLRLSDQGNIEVSVKFNGGQRQVIEVLNTTEIEQLYDICEDGLLGMRDRAMLAVFYGCGARRNEGTNIEVKDILAHRNLLYIRKGKGYKERYVPMIGQVRNDIVNYLITARPILINKDVHQYYFVGITGKALKSASLYQRFKKLLHRAGIEKKASLHTLRHSIATHLLLNGMKLSEIAQFLGHSSLESTQIYTHLKDDNYQ